MDIWEHEITMGGGGNWEFQLRVPELFPFFYLRNSEKYILIQKHSLVTLSQDI